MSISTTTCTNSSSEALLSKHVLLLQAKVVALQSELKDEQAKVSKLREETSKPKPAQGTAFQDLIQLDTGPETTFVGATSPPGSCDESADQFKESDTEILRNENEELKHERAQLLLDNETQRRRLEVMSEFLKQEIAIKQSYFAIATMQDAERVIDLAMNHGVIPPSYEISQDSAACGLIDMKSSSPRDRDELQVPSPRAYTAAEMYKVLEQQQAVTGKEGEQGPRTCLRFFTREISKYNVPEIVSDAEAPSKQITMTTEEQHLPKSLSTQCVDSGLSLRAVDGGLDPQEVTCSPESQVGIEVDMVKCALIIDDRAPIGSPHRWQNGWEVYVSLNNTMQGQTAITVTLKISKHKKIKARSKTKNKTRVFTLQWIPSRSGGSPMMTDLVCGVDTVDGEITSTPNTLQLPSQDEVRGSLTSVTLLSHHHLSTPFQRETWHGLGEDVEESLAALFDLSRPHTVKIMFLHP